jgi:uncharacterized membrane protein YGL010W
LRPDVKPRTIRGQAWALEHSSMICPPMPPWSLIEDWMARHRDPTSFVLHMFGIPPTILGILLIPIYLTLASIPIFLLALALFVGGYLIQFTGHLFDGTEPGEIAYLRAKLGWSYAKMTPAPPAASRQELA